MMLKIHYWPDGTWCYAEDLEEYLLSMSDDFSTATFLDSTTAEELDAIVDSLLEK